MVKPEHTDGIPGNHNAGSLPDPSRVSSGPVSFQDISGSTFAEGKRRFLDVVDKVRDVGGDMIPELARIVVIGVQPIRRQKSLIEAVARFNVPRDTGTCTRCPSEIRLRSAETWSCTISLRYEYDPNGQKLEGVRTVPFGPTFTDESQVEIMLRRAQLAILHPKTETSLFLNCDLSTFSKEGELGFSRNVICIEVSGPGLTDLTFVDLPGIIASGEQKMIDLIKEMVREYIAGDSIILVAITMRDDIDNQAAIMEARHADPTGIRTIGVLTKADTMQKGEESQWLPVVQNVKHPLQLGYFVTKQPSPEELLEGTTFAASRQREQEFFRSREPWRSLSGEIRSRLGTPNLTATLSTLLTEAIKRALPGVFAKINASLQQVRDDLSKLPAEPSSNPMGDMLERCQQVRDELAQHTKGAEDHVKLIQQNKANYLAFKKAIYSTAPQFLPFTKKEVSSGTRYREALFLREDRSASLPSAEGEETFLETDSHEEEAKDLDDVRHAIAMATTRELPHSVPFPAKVTMMLAPIKHWPGLVEECFDAIFPDVEALCNNITKDVFGRFEHGPLLGLIRDVLGDKIADLASQTKDILDRLLDMEGYPSTFNDHYFDATRAKLIAHYKDQRDQRRSESSQSLSDDSAKKEDEAIKEALSHLIRTNRFSHVNAADLPKLLPNDPYVQVIEFMAETRAYFQVAYKRVIDNVPLAIDRNFIVPLAKEIHAALISGLKIDTPEGADLCREYLQENPRDVQKRSTLLSTKKRLERAKTELRAIGL